MYDIIHQLDEKRRLAALGGGQRGGLLSLQFFGRAAATLAAGCGQALQSPRHGQAVGAHLCASGGGHDGKGRNAKR